MTKYVAMAGMFGCIPNVVETFDNLEDAVEYLLRIHEAEHDTVFRRKLERDHFVDLDLEIDGNQYAEIIRQSENEVQ